MTSQNPPPALATSQWLNTDEPQTLDMHLGKVILVEAFQMLCPGCVSHSLPQAQRVFQMFSRDDLVVLGLHSVFEHHDAMTPVSLKAFLYEYGLTFPVGVDAPSKGSDLPQTMSLYGMKGTPTLLLFGRDGALAAHQFGQVPDLELGARIASLMSRPGLAAGQEGDAGHDEQKPTSDAGPCPQGTCPV